MKYIYCIDQYAESKVLIDGKWWTARHSGGYGMLTWEIRLRYAWACLTGKADAVYFHGQ